MSYAFLKKVGEFSNPKGEMLEKGQIFRLDLDEALGDNTRVMLPHPEIIAASEIDHVLLIDDGKVKLTVVGKGDQYLECRVDVPGKISNRKVSRSNMLLQNLNCCLVHNSPHQCPFFCYRVSIPQIVS